MMATALTTAVLPPAGFPAFGLAGVGVVGALAMVVALVLVLRAGRAARAGAGVRRVPVVALPPATARRAA